MVQSHHIHVELEWRCRHSYHNLVSNIARLAQYYLASELQDLPRIAAGEPKEVAEHHLTDNIKPLTDTSGFQGFVTGHDDPPSDVYMPTD